MQLIIIVLAAFGLGFWFSRTHTADRLTDSTKNLTSRLRGDSRNTKEDNNTDSGQADSK